MFSAHKKTDIYITNCNTESLRRSAYFGVGVVCVPFSSMDKRTDFLDSYDFDDFVVIGRYEVGMLKKITDNLMIKLQWVLKLRIWKKKVNGSIKIV